MNPIREAISNLFQSPIGDMTFVAYLSYVNQAGKITPRSLMDILTVVCSFLEEQEKKNKQYEANFKEIEQILQKLVESKPEAPKLDGAVLPFTEGVPTQEDAMVKAADLLKSLPAQDLSDTHTCPICLKSFKNTLGKTGHMRSHKQKE